MPARYSGIMYINGREFPSPKRYPEMIVSTLVNSGRNALGEVVGQKVGRDQYKMNNMVWPHLDAETWSAMLKEFENFYREQEKELLCLTKQQLEDLGYANCGVTLTRVVDEIGNREYTFTIHHRKIDKMSMDERKELAAELMRDIALAENCSVYHEFLMYD